jgi:hypothetical protein
MKHLLACCLLLPCLLAGAAEMPIALVADPAGDDVGDGALVYPQRSEFQPGDLDLVSLRISRDERVFRFEATFRNAVRNPSEVATEGGGEALSSFARRGFFAFNLDLYFDQDRVPGRGNVFTLPGRQAGIDPAVAWEKAVVLTPRPELMRTQLISTLSEADPAVDRAQATALVDRQVFFVTDVRVRGRSVSFTVPASYLAAEVPPSQWALVAFVTGAKLTIEADLLAFGGGPRNPLERLALGAMQPEPGRPRDTFGTSAARPPLPIVDLLGADAEAQKVQLRAGGLLTGTALGPPPPAAAGQRGAPARSLLPGAAAMTQAPQVPAPPAPQTATSAPPAPPAPPAPTAAIAPVPAATVVPVVPAAPAVPAMPAAATAAPAGAAVGAAAGAAVAAPAASAPPAAAARPAPAAAASAAERLRVLKDLLDRKLIDEAEYRRIRERILGEL